ncbi:YeeE/YedE thiosulfate transporter family protein [Athalassotoga saccharophila]|uniref:YeeE/YedE thiosulfate transporter family protein n=1 Tax=Athalassotoga saccharophila TaxID=1441386 RepID=UPI001379B3A5|nr:YeeE/YedE thiosulfate transporter family protein [Athalassotoga saccharophila]BBJ27477.1 hypothetical protein ATHSA_0346 [Athalassotoga saccharophila]
MKGILFTAPQWVGILIGFVIGALAEAWGIANPESIIRLVRWKDRLFITCIALGGAIAVLVLYALYAMGINMHFSLKPLYWIGVGLGGAIFGIGLALSGYFPGSEWMSLGEGRRDALFAIPGGLLGAATWTLLFQTSAGQWLVNTFNSGSVIITGQTIASLSPLTLFLIAIPYAIGLFLLAYFLPRFPKTKHSCLRSLIGRGKYDENTPLLKEIREDTAAYLLEGSIAKKGSKAEKFAKTISSEPNVYSPLLVLIAAGVGITVVIGIMLHQIFGESTTYSWIVGVLLMPSYKYSVSVINHIGWEPFSDIGTFLGAFFSAVVLTKRFTAFRKVVPPSWRNRFGNEEWKRAIGVFIGSFLMLFGARMAGGCASGHILSGVVQMAASGLYFGLIVMIAGVITAAIVYGKTSEKVKN